MRVFDRGAWFSVACSNIDVYNFYQQWPCSGLQELNNVTFVFDTSNGDLVDMHFSSGNSEKWDGPALKALSEDAQSYGYARLRERSRSKLSEPMRQILYRQESIPMITNAR
jgi:hypothetical protein